MALFIFFSIQNHTKSPLKKFKFICILNLISVLKTGHVAFKNQYQNSLISVHKFVSSNYAKRWFSLINNKWAYFKANIIVKLINIMFPTETLKMLWFVKLFIIMISFLLLLLHNMDLPVRYFMFAWFSPDYICSMELFWGLKSQIQL